MSALPQQCPEPNVNYRPILDAEEGGAYEAGNEAALYSGCAGNANRPAMTDDPVLAYGSWLAETPAHWPEAA